jgi:hypothetical protein
MKLMFAYLFCTSLVAMEGSGERNRFLARTRLSFLLKQESFLRRTFSGDFVSPEARVQCEIDAHFGAQVALCRKRERNAEKMG